MEKDEAPYDPTSLLRMYMQVSKEFSAALSDGASWEQLQEYKSRIRQISEQINKKNRDGVPPPPQ